MNSITELLNLEDADIFISNISINGTKKILTLETKPIRHFCPVCGFKMYSRGIKVRTINHPVLQDGYELVLKLKQRRWRCTNTPCSYTINESFNFVDKRKRNTNATDMLIIHAFRDLSVSASSIASKYKVSDTYVLDTFDRYVKMDRLPLSDIISVDEVCLDLDPYINWVNRYFPNAVSVVDSFHVIQWITHKLDLYIRELIKNFKKRDRDAYTANGGIIDEHTFIPASREVYLLQKYRWLILANHSSITYHSDLRMDTRLHCLMNTYDYEDSLFMIDPNLRELRDLKELYVQFNTRNAGKPMDARIELDKLINHYLHCGNSIFVDFANLLIRNHAYIINSFVMVEKYGAGKIYSSRLSNGPIESLNRKVKDLKRLGRGYRNFEHFRTRFLYATRDTPVINGINDYNPVTYFDMED